MNGGRAWLTLPALLLASGLAAAQSEEDLFGPVADGDAPPAAAAPGEAFLVSGNPEWGGLLENTLTASWAWGAYPQTWAALAEEAVPALRARLRADLFFDARPARSFRAFGKAKFSYASGDPGEDWRWQARIFELFSDFNFRERVFLRAGKQVVQWGVGYFFSPADVLSLVSIDPEGPEQEREGPLAIKGQAPLGAHNLYLYLVSDGIERLDQVALAPKLELVLGGWELGLGAYYQRDSSPKAMLTLTGPLGKLDLFGEALLQWGSDRTYVRLAPPPDDTYRIADRLLFSGTAGAGYLNPERKLAVFAQYFYNGPGYERFEAAVAAAASAALLAGELTAADLLYPSRHYLAVSAELSDLFDVGLGASVFLLAALSDGSGKLVPTLSWEPVDYLRLHAGLELGFGGNGTEYAPTGPGLTLEIGLDAGGGRF